MRKVYSFAVILVSENHIPMKTTQFKDYIIRYLDYIDPQDLPDKDILVLMHGLGASAERWLKVVPMLSKHYRLVIPDIIGSGYSDKPTVEYTIDFFLEFVLDFLGKLGIERMNLLGSSFGGFVAAEFAIRFANRVNKLILAAPAGIMRSSTRVLDQYIMAALYPTHDNALRAFKEMAFDPRIVSDDTIKDFVNRMRLPNSKYAFMSTLLGIKDSPNFLPRLVRITSPTLGIWGENDKMIPQHYAQELETIPNYKLVLMENCGHTPYVEKPSEFSNIVLRFLSSRI
jgi:2-hydroxy-6-oxonona-2,4-dienedioate hydrolase